jgi:hypothetical protein
VEVTLAYPQLVALNAIEAYLSLPEDKRNPEITEEMINELEKNKDARVPVIADKAETLLNRFSGLGSHR